MTIRKPTRRKFWGRSSIVQALRAAAGELEAAIAETGKPVPESPVAAQLRKVVKSLESAIEAERIYSMNRKRIKDHLEAERKRILELINEVCGVAVLPQEKLLQARQKKKGGI